MAASAALAVVIAIVSAAIAAQIRDVRSVFVAETLLVAVWLATVVAFVLGTTWVHVSPITLGLILGYVGQCIAMMTRGGDSGSPSADQAAE